jgi:hypothetical protein
MKTTRYTERFFAPYHAEDLADPKVLENVKSIIEDDLEFDSIRFRFNRIEPLDERYCEERNRIDFDGDPVLSPIFDRAIVYDVEETV